MSSCVVVWEWAHRIFLSCKDSQRVANYLRILEVHAPTNNPHDLASGLKRCWIRIPGKGWKAHQLYLCFLSFHDISWHLITGPSESEWSSSPYLQPWLLASTEPSGFVRSWVQSDSWFTLIYCIKGHSTGAGQSLHHCTHESRKASKISAPHESPTIRRCRERLANWASLPKPWNAVEPKLRQKSIFSIYLHLTCYFKQVCCE